ncbi:recombinase family protein [Clostridium perfringens]
MPRSRKAQEARLTNNRTIWKFAVYIRFSREDGNDESLSVINQKKILKEYLEEMFEEEYVLVDFYVDGLAGTDYERARFQRMIKKI